MRYRKNEKINIIKHLSGGMNTADAPSEIKKYEMASCENWEVNEKTLRTAAGWVNYGSDAQELPIFGGFEGRFENGVHVMVRQKGTELQYDNGAGSWITAQGGLTQARCSFTMLNNIILWSNGTDTIKSTTDGITWTDQAGLPKAKKIVHNGKNRILFVNQPAIPSKISWSNINNPLTVDASSYQFIGKNDGEQVLDTVVTEKGGIYIFKTSMVYMIGDVSFDMLGVDPIGTMPYIPFTAVTTENSVIATGYDGIYEIVGGTIRHISKNLKRGTTHCKNSDTPVATYFKNKYRVALPIDHNYNDVELVLDRQQPTGDPYNPYAITLNKREIGCYITEQNRAGTTMRHRVYVGGSRVATFAWINIDHDQGVTQGVLGQPQTCTFETKFFQDEAPFFIKRFLKYFINIFSNQDTTIQLCYRFDTEGTYVCKPVEVTMGSFGWKLADGASVDFDEGFGFKTSGSDERFIDMEKTGVPRGVQFKIKVTTTKDLTILSSAYKYLIKNSFH